jgi:hypothetical protein
MSPLDALYAFEDLQARILIPIHHGAFALSYERLAEPRRWLEELVRAQRLEPFVVLLEPGQSRLFVPPRRSRETGTGAAESASEADSDPEISFGPITRTGVDDSPEIEISFEPITDGGESATDPGLGVDDRRFGGTMPGPWPVLTGGPISAGVSGTSDKGSAEAEEAFAEEVTGRLGRDSQGPATLDRIVIASAAD